MANDFMTLVNEPVFLIIYFISFAILCGGGVYQYKKCVKTKTAFTLGDLLLYIFSTIVPMFNTMFAIVVLWNVIDDSKILEYQIVKGDGDAPKYHDHGW